jgi:DNA-binding NarL/FixJ family response regulator
VLVAGFRSSIATPGNFLVIECPDVNGLLSLAGEHKPQLILIDADNDMDLVLNGTLKAAAPDAGLILWVDRVSREFVQQAIGFGVRGVLRKNAAPDLYMQCFDRVGANELWLENELSQKLLCMRTVRLSPREKQLVGLLTQGLRNKEIAGRMNITEGTAKVYLSRLFDKTGAGDRFELAMYVLQNLENGKIGGPTPLMAAM